MVYLHIANQMGALLVVLENLLLTMFVVNVVVVVVVNRENKLTSRK